MKDEGTLHKAVSACCLVMLEKKKLDGLLYVLNLLVWGIFGLCDPEAIYSYTRDGLYILT